MPLRIRSLAQGSRLALLLAAALSLPACVVETPAYHRHGPYGRGGPVEQIDGFVTFEGRCPTLREYQSNRVFALAGNTRPLRPGDHVTLSTRETDGNACGLDGPTLEVVEIDTVWRGDDHRSAYFDISRDGDFGRFIAENRDRGSWYAERYDYLNGNGRGRRDDRDDDRQDRGRYENPPDNPPGNPPGPPPVDPNDRYDRNAPPPPETGNPPEEDRDDEREQLSVTGRLDFSGSCPSIHTPQGDSWDLAGDLGSFHDGDRVRVLGVTAGRSSCGGRALEVSEIQGR